MFGRRCKSAEMVDLCKSADSGPKWLEEYFLSTSTAYMCFPFSDTEYYDLEQDTVYRLLGSYASLLAHRGIGRISYSWYGKLVLNGHMNDKGCAPAYLSRDVVVLMCLIDTTKWNMSRGNVCALTPVFHAKNAISQAPLDRNWIERRWFAYEV